MTNYINGKIYKIYSPSNSCLRYIGSTVNSLAKRLASHKHKYALYKNDKHHYVTSFKIFNESDDWKIELMEKIPCKTKEELRKVEGFYIRNFRCVNKKIAGRTIREYKQDNNTDKKYYEKNKEKLLVKQKEYRKKNIEKIKIKEKEYHKKNRERMCEKARNWRKNNKQIIACECGSEIVRANLPSHKKTKKHMSFIKNKLLI